MVLDVDPLIICQVNRPMTSQRYSVRYNDELKIAPGRMVLH
jgi:hypothetical protein